MVYRSNIRQLTDGLSEPAIRLQAIEAIQNLIDLIKVMPTNTGLDVELHGELGAIMEIVDLNDQRPAELTAGRSLSVVAGVRSQFDLLDRITAKEKLVAGARTTLDLLCTSTDLKPKLKL